MSATRRGPSKGAIDTYSRASIDESKTPNAMARNAAPVSSPLSQTAGIATAATARAWMIRRAKYAELRKLGIGACSSSAKGIWQRLSILSNLYNNRSHMNEDIVMRHVTLIAASPYHANLLIILADAKGNRLHFMQHLHASCPIVRHLTIAMRANCATPTLCAKSTQHLAARRHSCDARVRARARVRRVCYGWRISRAQPST